MAPYSKYFLGEFVGIAIAIICVMYTYFKYITFSYWQSKNIDYVKPIVPFGNVWPLLSGQFSIGELFRDFYFSNKKSPVFGVYMMHKPVLVVKDPNLIRFVLTKKFAHFQDRGIYCNEKIDPLSAHLFSVPGEKWRFLMSKFSPAFTSSKIKQMFFTVGECFEKMVDFIAEKAKNRELVEVQDLFASFGSLWHTGQHHRES
ncbi:cytochrome P450 6A1-like [Neodiprion virginianus]|uniref:cytochrome P450 6A1-like n=1 Tax=Neodiprion virginianus TaxID=2961670 RepID=UPI001EE72AAC|nr:cytochrome P450 6A1-like [Neodiprion virginianus]